MELSSLGVMSMLKKFQILDFWVKDVQPVLCKFSSISIYSFNRKHNVF